MRNNVWVMNSPLLATISGGQAQISGQVIYIGSTNTINIATILGLTSDDSSTANKGLVTVSMLHAYDKESNNFVRVRAHAPVSGGGYLLHTMISGQPVRLVNDGINNVVMMSGQTFRLPNDGINNVVRISGEVVHDFGTQIVTTNLVTAIGTSGGTQLPTQQCIRCRVRNLSGNAPMFVGGVGGQAPFSGKGQVLYGGEVRDYDVNNFNAISVFAVQANQQVSVDGVL